MISKLTLFLLIISLGFNFFFYQKIKNPDNGILVLEVLDGDTLLLEQDVRLRLRHIDAPELEFCGGSEAKQELVNLAKGKRITIKEQIIDQYGRPMGLVYIGNRLINAEMIKSGWARYHSDSSTEEKKLKQEADRVKNAGMGIFSPKCYQKENPENPKCDIKGNIDKNSTKHLYYYPGCAQYEFTIIEKDLGEAWFCTEEEAQRAGFLKAESCYDKKYLTN